MQRAQLLAGRVQNRQEVNISKVASDIDLEHTIDIKRPVETCGPSSASGVSNGTKPQTESEPLLDTSALLLTDNSITLDYARRQSKKLRTQLRNASRGQKKASDSFD